MGARKSLSHILLVKDAQMIAKTREFQTTHIPRATDLAHGRHKGIGQNVKARGRPVSDTKFRCIPQAQMKPSAESGRCLSTTSDVSDQMVSAITG